VSSYGIIPMSFVLDLVSICDTEICEDDIPIIIVPVLS